MEQYILWKVTQLDQDSVSQESPSRKDFAGNLTFNSLINSTKEKDELHHRPA